MIIIEIFVLLLFFVIFLMLLLALASPFESLGWWSGWSTRHLDPDLSLLPDEEVPSEVQEDAGFFVVYFTGIIGLGDGAGGYREIAQLHNIAKRLPKEAVMIHDVFPYSCSNNPLTGERQFAAMWDKLDHKRRKFKSWINPASLIIIFRNLFQFGVSADRRYGPLNNVGVAREIVRSLLHHGYPLNSGKPVYLIGYSGGGQIAVGAARYLQLSLNAPIRVIGWGGAFSDDSAIAYVDKLVQLRGSRDPVPWMSRLFFPGCWPIVPYSPWNKAKRNGRFQQISPGPLVHFGRHDYFSQKATFEDGETYADRIARLSAEIILQETAVTKQRLQHANSPNSS